MVLLIISGIYAIIIGIGIIGLWSMLLRTGQVPELKTESIAIKFHITAEMIMGSLSREWYFSSYWTTLGALRFYSIYGINNLRRY